MTSERNEAEVNATATEKKWAAYNLQMVELFAERDSHPVDSPEHTAVAERILALWVE